MKTEWQLRDERVAQIVELCVLDKDEDRVLLSKIDTLSAVGVEVAYTLLHRVNRDLATYWKERAESAEAFIQGGVTA